MKKIKILNILLFFFILTSLGLFIEGLDIFSIFVGIPICIVLYILFIISKTVKWDKDRKKKKQIILKEWIKSFIYGIGVYIVLYFIGYTFPFLLKSEFLEDIHLLYYISIKIVAVLSIFIKKFLYSNSKWIHYLLFLIPSVATIVWAIIFIIKSSQISEGGFGLMALGLYLTLIIVGSFLIAFLIMTTLLLSYFFTKTIKKIKSSKRKKK